jgi:hypothetical protein
MEFVDMVREVESSNPGGCLTYTSSFNGPLRKEFLTSICCNLKL